MQGFRRGGGFERPAGFGGVGCSLRLRDLATAVGGLRPRVEGSALQGR